MAAALISNPLQPDSASRALRVVAIGGGTGLSTLLRGLKRHVRRPGEPLPPNGAPHISDLSAVVTVTDDGGSSGRLRKEFNILPPGDIRNCIVALSEEEKLLSRLFQHRFAAGSGSGLEGHSFGNLFLTALTAVMGDFSDAVRESSAILATRGHIYPATTSDVQLEATMADGTVVRGETNITASKGRIADLHLLPPDARPLPQTLDAIAQADVITIGPGSLFTSLAPNLLVQGIPEAIAASPAVKIYLCNLMTQANESLGLTAADHVRTLQTYGKGRLFDFALVNTAPISPGAQQKYAKENQEPITADLDAIRALGVTPVAGNYAEEAGLVRHAATQAAHDLLAVADEELSRRQSEVRHAG